MPRLLLFDKIKNTVRSGIPKQEAIICGIPPEMKDLRAESDVSLAIFLHQVVSFTETRSQTTRSSARATSHSNKTTYLILPYHIPD